MKTGALSRGLQVSAFPPRAERMMLKYDPNNGGDVKAGALSRGLWMSAFPGCKQRKLQKE